MQEAKAVILRTDQAETTEVRIKVGEKGTKDFVEVVPNTMELDDDSDDVEDAEDVEITAEKSRAEVLEEKVTERIDLEDSEEEDTVTLTKIT